MNILANNEKTTIKYLSEKLEVSRRTIYRDLEDISMAGFPIVSTPGYGGGISIVEGYRFDKNLLSSEDWEQILIGLNAIKTMGDNEKIEYLIGRIAPGMAGLVLSRCNAMRLLMKKYDYIEELDKKGEPANSQARRKIPWKELLAEDEEANPVRTFKDFWLPWKDMK